VLWFKNDTPSNIYIYDKYKTEGLNMKKINKWIISIFSIVLIISGTNGIKNYLRGPSRPINSIIVSGNIKDVNKAKEIYKDNTKYTKDYKYKILTKTEKATDENGKPLIEKGKQLIDEFNYLIINKRTAKEMLKNQVLRVRKDKEINGNIETEILTDIPNIDGDKCIYLGSPYEELKLDINGKNIPIEYGSYAWIGYYPSEVGPIIITDDETYKSIDNEEKVFSLIRLEKGRKDLRNAKDKEKVEQKLLGVPNIVINYAEIQD
jgi:hypothetical protein